MIIILHYIAWCDNTSCDVTGRIFFLFKSMWSLIIEAVLVITTPVLLYHASNKIYFLVCGGDVVSAYDTFKC